MKRFSLIALLLIPAFVLSACAPAIRSAPIAAGDLASLIAALDQEMPDLLATYNTPGATVAIAQNGELVWEKGYGLADQESSIPATPDTVYQIASISKTVAATGIMRLVEQGKLDLDASASQYLTRWEIPDSDFDESGVTLRRLLSHSAGLSVHGYPGYEPNATLPSLEDSLSGRPLGPNYLVELVAEPGQAYSYSGGGYTLLQLIVEEVSGQPFAETMRQEVIDPLGLAHTSFVWREDLRDQTAKAYDMDGRLLPNYLFAEQAAAGLYTTAGELVRFGAAHLPGQELLSDSSLAKMQQVAIAIPAKSAEGFFSGMDGYGLGWFIETLPDGSRAVNHTGGNQGWRSLLVVAPQQRAALVVLTNSDNGSGVHDEIRARWADWLGVGTPKGIHNARMLANLIIAFSGLLILGFAVWLYNFVRKVRQGKRSFCFKLNLRSKSGRKMIFGLLGVLLLTALWFFLLQIVVKMMFPLQTVWVGLAFMLWVAALALGSVSERAKA
ncbi:MAG: beta-lactamase family protein [Anaerolineaceae bacterium]|nr:beta-lactamase family protein [Anaerolineaceae bacterium]